MAFARGRTYAFSVKAGLAEQTVAGLSRLCAKGLEWTTLSAEANALVRRAVSFERVCWHTIDPATLLLTGGVTENLPAEGYPTLVSCEYETEDVNKWSFLATCPWPVGILSQTTRGNPTESRRYRELLRPIGVSDELRASFVTEEKCWGALGLYRDGSAPSFDDAEAGVIARSAGALAAAFQRALLLSAAFADDAPDGPGLILLDARDEALSMSPAAKCLLDELVEASRLAPEQLPPVVHAVAARARAVAKGGAPGEARSRVPSRVGRWLVFHGSVLDGTHAGETAVIIEVARPAEIAPLIVEAYALSGREREVLQLVLRGLSTKAIASTLHISAYTAQDHLQAIYKKVGVRARRELVARIYSDHYFARVVSHTPLGPDGWFAS
jgi:DNA-binding NarL/FixJ family response regulator